MAGLNETEKSLKRMEDSLGSINKRLNETERILLNNSALASHLGFVDDTGIKQYVAEMKTLFELYKSLKNINGIPELDAYFVGLKYTLLQVSDTITNIKKNSKATTINTPQGTLPAGKKSEFAYDNYKFNSKAHDEYIRQPIGEIKGIVEKQKLTLDLSTTGLENSEAQVKKLNGQLDKFREKLLGDNDVMKNSLLTPEQVDAYVEALKKAIPVQLEFAKSFDNIAYGKEHLKHFLEDSALETQLGRVSNYMLGNTEKRYRTIDPAKGIGVKGNTEEINTFDINDYAEGINKRTSSKNKIMQGKIIPLYRNTIGANGNLTNQEIAKEGWHSTRLDDVVDTSELKTGMEDILSSNPKDYDDAINKMKKYNELIAATIAKTEELRIQTLATKKELAGTDNVKTYLDKKKELGKSARYDSDYKAAEQSDEVKDYLEVDKKLKNLNKAKNLLKSKLISGISTDTDDIITSVNKNNVPVTKIGNEVGNEQLRNLLSNTNTSELEQVIKFKPEIDKNALEKMKEEALALSSDTPDDFGIKTSGIDKMKEEAFALSSDIPDDFGINTSKLDKMKEEALKLSDNTPDDFGAISDAYIGRHIANNEKKQQSDKKTSQVAQQTAQIDKQLAQQTASVEEQLAQQTASVEEQLDNRVTETKSKNKQRQISDAEKAKRAIIDASFEDGRWISAEKQSDIYRQHLDSAKRPADQYKLKADILNSDAKAAKNSEEEIYNAVIRQINEYAVKNDKSMPIDSKIGLLKDALSRVENNGSKVYDNIVKELSKAISAKERSSKSNASVNTADINNQKNAIRSLYEETKNYVSTQEALSGQKMSFSDQAAYYDQQANKMKQLAGESKEYIEILKLKRQAEAKAADEAKRAAEAEKKAQEDAVKAARDRVNNTLGTIKKIADGVNNAVNKIVSIIRNGINLINKVFSTIGKFVGRITTGVKAIVSIFGSLSNRVRGTAGDSNRLNGSFNILKGTATELRSKIQLLKEALNTLFNNSMITNASKLIGSVTTMNIIIGEDLTDNTIAWAESMEKAFGVDANSLIAGLGEITGVLHGLGMKTKDVATGAVNFGIMARYLGMIGMAGGDADQVMSKLTSGMKGMTQSIDDLGLSVREAEMDNFLKNLKKSDEKYANIGTSFSSLNEEARVYVRYAALMNQFANRFGEIIRNVDGTIELKLDVEKFHKALNSVNGRLSIVKQSFNGMISTLGIGFSKIAAVIGGFLIPVFNFIESKIKSIFAWLSKITGINFSVDIDQASTLDFDTSGTEDAINKVDDLNDKLDKTKDKADKAKGSLQSFDRVNNVTSSSGSGSGSDSKDNFDYSTLAADFEKLIDPTQFDSAYQSFLDKLKEDNKNLLNTLRNNFNEFAKKLTGRANFDLGFDWPAIKENLDTTWKNIKELIKSWGTFFIEIGLKIADDINIGKIITKFSEFTSAVTDLAVAFSEVLIPVLRNFYDEVLSPIVKLVGEKIVNAFDKAIEKVKKWTKYLKDNKPELIEEWTEKLKHFFNVVTGKESANPEDGVIGTVLEILNKIGKVIKALIPIISELASALGVFLKEEFLPWLNEKLGELAEWLSENKDAIVKFLKDIAGLVWGSFKVFVDLIGKLVDFCVKHPTAVKTFLVGLVAIKIASWATSSAAGIGQLVFQLQLLSKLGGITKALGGVGTAATATSTELATIGAASGTAAKTSVLSKILGKTGSAVVGGLGTVGTALGSTATTSTGLAVAGGASIAGIVGGIAGIGSGIKDLYSASKETNEEIKEQKNWSGGTKIGMVGAGAATGAAIGSVVPGVGTAVGAAVGAGVSGVAAIFKGSDISEWLHDAWDNKLKPFFTETIPEAFGKLVDGLKTFFTETVPTTVSNIGTGISTFFTETVPGFFSDLWEGVKTFFTETVPQTISNIASSISTFFTETVPGFFGNLVDGVVQFFTEDVPYALGYIAGSLKVFFTETVPGFFGGLWKDIKTFFTETIPTAIETIKEKAQTFFTETIPNFFAGIWKKIKAFFTETIPTAIETIKEKAQTFFTETIPNFFAGIWKKIKAFFTETIPNAVETIKTKAKTFLTVTIPNFFGGIWKSLKTFFTETIPTALETIKTKATTFLTVTIPHFFSGIWKKIKAFFTETIPTAISKVKTGIKTFFTETIPNKVKGLFGGIGDLFGGAVDWIKNKFSSIGSNFSAGYDAAVSSKSKATKAKSVTTHAVGGSIAGGQLFIANENGGAELVGNITGASGAQVANNGMIIEAMTSGVFEGVYNALAEINNQRVGNSMGGGNTTIKLDGFGLIDSSTLSELARMLAPYLSSNNKNIADVNFSI